MCGKEPYRRFGVSTAGIAAVVILAVAVGMLSEPVLAQGRASGIDFQFLDTATELIVPSVTVKWGRIGENSISPLSQSAVSSSEGKLPLQLSPGQYAFEISAPGYKPMRLHYGVTLGLMVPLNVNLAPVVQPEELRKATVAGELRAGMELDDGFVSDALTHRPIAHVQVRLQHSGATATTNSRGYFRMMAPAQSTSHLRSAKEFPPLDTLTASAPGYKTYILTGILHVPQSWMVINIALTPGTGVTHHDTTPVPLMPAARSRSLPKQQPAPSPSPIPRFLLRWLSGSATPMVREAQQSTLATTPVTSAITLPSTIIVGSNCNGQKYGCTIATPYPLETYVQYGLNKEFLSNWDTNSLMAGAVAYRSYGAWYVAHPLCPATGSSCPVEYDICDNTACQVFNTTRPPTTTVAAAQATAGIVLSSDGINIAEAFYAAYNDGGPCPDGQIGDATTDWPCMLLSPA